MSRHASLDDLASFIEGGLRPRKTGRVASHLASCSACAGHVQDLEQLPNLLASIAYPPIPDELSSRIELAITTESVTRVTVSSDGGPVPALAGADGAVPGESVSGESSRRDLPEPGRRRRPERRGWRLPGLSSPLGGSLAAVGAAVVIAGGGYVIASHLSSGTTASGGSSGSANAPASRAAAPQAVAPANGPSMRVREGGQIKSVPSVVTSTNFSPDHLQAQVQTALVTARATRISAAKNDVASPYPLANGTAAGSVGQLSQCVGNIAAGRNVLLVDIAKYEQRPATIIVVGTAPDGPGTIYVVGAKCGASDKDILAQRPLPAPSH